MTGGTHQIDRGLYRLGPDDEEGAAAPFAAADALPDPEGEPPVDTAPAEDVPRDDTPPVLAMTVPVDADRDELDRARTRRLLAAGVAIAAIVAWMGTMLWLGGGAVFRLDPVLQAGFFAALLIVPIAVGVLWLVLLRTSRAEARRFGASARAMRAESAALEASVAALGRRLEENRRILAEQTAAFGALGEATERRFATVGDALGAQIAAAGNHARALNEAATGARGSVGDLLSALPEAEARVGEATALLDRTGSSAADHASALERQFAALATQGREADTVAAEAAERLAAQIERMDTVAGAAGARLEALTANAASALDAMLDRTAASIDAARHEITVQGEATLTMIEAHQAALDTAARTSAEALGARLDGLESTIERLAQRLDEQRRAGDDLVGGLDGGIARIGERLADFHAQGIERTQTLAASISALGGSADAMTEALRTGDEMAGRTIGTTEQLLTALDAAAREIDETLPDALARLDARIDNSRRVVGEAKPELLALVTAAESTHDAIEAIAGVIAEQRRTLDELSAGLLDTLAEGRTRADALGGMLDQTIGRAHRFTDEAAPRLMDALQQVRGVAEAAAEQAQETLSAVIPHAARGMETAAADALARAAGDTVVRQMHALADAGDAAVQGTMRAVERLQSHMQTIAEQTAIVETRLEDVRAEREAAEHDSFARRASILIEQLNSASIDIAKRFAPDVSDSAWAAYLKGDRGVFTRRAVRIVDSNTARDIARLHDDDAGFRDTVNRYVHDFEAMLRTVLSQRDGAALGVTLLSSDFGKLYVALAQAIERLR